LVKYPEHKGEYTTFRGNGRIKSEFSQKHYCEDEYSPIVAKGGCPNYGKLEKSFDVAIIDVQNRLSCWKNQHLSIGGRVVINN